MTRRLLSAAGPFNQRDGAMGNGVCNRPGPTLFSLAGVVRGMVGEVVVARRTEPGPRAGQHFRGYLRPPGHTFPATDKRRGTTGSSPHGPHKTQCLQRTARGHKPEGVCAPPGRSTWAAPGGHWSIGAGCGAAPRTSRFPAGACRYRFGPGRPERFESRTREGGGDVRLVVPLEALLGGGVQKGEGRGQQPLLREVPIEAAVAVAAR
jgi:hypothetical protein